MTGAPEKIVIDNATLWHGDCREIYPRLPRIDAIITDPPYGIDYQHGGGGRNSPHVTRLGKIIGDHAPFDPSWMIDAAGIRNSTGRNKATKLKLALFGADHMARFIPPQMGAWCVWDKSCGGGANDSFADAEFWWQTTRTARRIYRHLWKGMMRDMTGDPTPGARRHHTSEKPVALMQFVIESLRVQVGSSILDPYMGSGSTGVAALLSGRKFVGIECDRRVFDAACERIAVASAQTSMLDATQQPEKE